MGRIDSLTGARPLRRRDVLRAAVAAAAAMSGWGCVQSTTTAAQRDWTARLSGSSLVLLGEVHDNPLHHRLRAAVLRQALEDGWRPAVVMEQFDLDRQADIDRARAERPDDAQHVITQAGGAAGWHWSDYQAFVALALQYQLPLLAGNLPRNTANRLARDDYTTVLGAERVRTWCLADAPDAAWQAAQEREIDVGHCGALPQRLWPALARGQFARDAAMAHLLSLHVPGGAVLLAGNGHVRRDLGVPRWLQRQGTPATLVVGFIERDTPPPAAGAYDAVVITEPAARDDPCDAFKARPLPGARIVSSFERA
ncbi:MAG: ChaN family lipoprotein [Burkholderiales bacterium]